jgi:hypothetical protein
MFGAAEVPKLIIGNRSDFSLAAPIRGCIVRWQCYLADEIEEENPCAWTTNPFLAIESRTLAFASKKLSLLSAQSLL